MQPAERLPSLQSLRRPLAALAAALALACCAGAARAAATIVIVNLNEAGVGFNDPTPVAPVGGNPGTTLGQQRLNAFQRAADLWGATLTSDVTIRIGASFEPLSCTATSAVLGAAGANEIWSDFPNAPRAETWYPAALASKLAGEDVATPGQPHIIARFNSRLGLSADCLPGEGFYLGLDRNFGNGIDLVTVLLHEFAHGLGFQTFTDDETGEEILGIPSIWDYYLLDNRNNRTWVESTPAQRAASAVTWRGLSWNGPIVTAAVPQVLGPASNLGIAGPAAGTAAGNYGVGDATFGPALSNPPVRGQLMPVVDQPDGNGYACQPLGTLNALAVRGNIALVDRGGGCDFTVKARNVQAAGALGMVVADNQPGDVAGLGGSDPTIAIPSVRVTQADGATIKAALQRRARTQSGVVASLGLDSARLAGTDAAGRILLYTPGAYSPGSSVSHYTTEARPNQLMEPAINTDLTHDVTPPRDLTFPLLRDIGW
ncbi:PA domain-containing protein [uncultured Massilia sp.]|uniref:PA domain-containing protein n=1 Tax=uncultured Massilia sp. TaxID=169973 RepID=UPI0025DE2521|nr:PA domain-containing protein [uncultured Massilia sp.]